MRDCDLIGKMRLDANVWARIAGAAFNLDLDQIARHPANQMHLME